MASKNKTESAKAPESNGSETKKKCPVSKEEFIKHAEPKALVIGGVPLGALMPKEMSTGSLGFHTNGSTKVMINGKECNATWQAQIILNHSKPE